MPSLKRQLAQLWADPVLRSWLIGRAVGLLKAPAPFARHLPPYAWNQLPLEITRPTWQGPAARIADTPVAGKTPLPLAGIDIDADPARPDDLFDRPVDDIEVDLARHRFAWLPLCPDVPAGIFAALWQTWRRRFFAAEGMHWHPYTAAERAINAIDAAGRLGLPDDAGRFAADLAHHAVMIAERLEYFGDHDTSNHLANNGRGLYRIGCAIGDENARELGFDILGHEAERIFLPGGTLREGSSHYHFLYLRNYLDAWLCAARHGLDDDAAILRAVAGELMEAARHLVLPNSHVLPDSLALIGDISPDCPPSFLAGLEDGAGPWTDILDGTARERLKELAAIVEAPDAGTAIRDGWLRAHFGRWAAIAHVPAAGWPFMPGHAHQDMGSADIHVDGRPLFVDPGRGRYGEDGDAALYRSSAVHGTLRIDGADPYPPNKPYYTDAFRNRHAGPAAAMLHADGFTVAHGGYRRLGADDVRRRWHFSDSELRIEDGVAGHGRHKIERALVSPLAVRGDGDAVIVGERFRISVDGVPASCAPVTIWRAYNDGAPGTRIVFEITATLPWSGTIRVKDIA